HQIVSYDPRNGIDDIPEADVAFPVLHGMGGEDGSIQVALERANIPYVGSDPAASSLCFDKWAYKQKIQKAGLPTPEAMLVTKGTVWQSHITKHPFVLKPISGGSSIDTFIIRDLANMDKSALENSLIAHTEMLLEELIEGIELTVGILGNQALPAVEITPPTNGEFDYENKYNGKTQEICPPLHVSSAVHKKAQELALEAHLLVNCRDISRTDIIATPAGRLMVLETNTMPGMTDQSLYPKAAAANGLVMADLVDRLVQAALARA
ncbi:MAG: ATP-grasp domain-containing protein, partial [Patescibacteria group bacterium]